jgi:branched-chain amino acid transport system substrate-binding protein
MRDMKRRAFLKSSAAAAAALATHAWSARAADTPGVSAAEIRIGQTMPYSGPASAYGVIGKTEAAYFGMINQQGGVNGRKIKLISLDDGYSPPKAVELTRRLVEQDEVAFLFNGLGTPSNVAVRAYLNVNKIPQLFVAAGAGLFNDPHNFPWTIAFQPNYQTEAKIFAKHILATKPDARIGILYQNDDFGKDYLIGLRQGLGAEHAGMLIQAVSYETSEPTVDSAIITLQGAGADTLIYAATPKFAAQAIRKTHDLGWSPTRYVADVSLSVSSVMKPAGFEKAKGVITANYRKDTTDPRWKDDPDVKAFADFAKTYLSPSDYIDSNAIYGFAAAAMIVQVLMQCGDDLSRQSIMRQALNLKDLRLPMLLPGVTINTAPDTYNPIRRMQIQRFNGEGWDLFGDLLEG